MTRRDFLATSAAVCAAASVHAEEIPKQVKRLNALEPLIEAVQEHMFPSTSKLPSAKEMKATSFLKETITHASYDRDIRLFVIEGAEELQSRTEGSFLQMSEAQKEKALRSYEKTNYGRSWLSRIMTLTMEAIFSDPVYGSNIHEKGWKAVDSYGGIPRPVTRYIKL